MIWYSMVSSLTFWLSRLEETPIPYTFDYRLRILSSFIFTSFKLPPP